MLKNQLYKIITIISLLTGAILGLISLIPFLSFKILVLIMFFMAPFIIIYFKNLKIITDITTDKSIIYGAISGFTGYIGYSIVFFPMAFIIDSIFKTQSFFWVKIVGQNFFFTIMTVFFTALLCAMFNAFSGFLTSYIIEYFSKTKR